jgi:hypothetical protein
VRERKRARERKREKEVRAGEERREEREERGERREEREEEGEGGRKYKSAEYTSSGKKGRGQRNGQGLSVGKGEVIKFIGYGQVSGVVETSVAIQKSMKRNEMKIK